MVDVVHCLPIGPTSIPHLPGLLHPGSIVIDYFVYLSKVGALSCPVGTDCLLLSSRLFAALWLTSCLARL